MPTDRRAFLAAVPSAVALLALGAPPRAAAATQEEAERFVSKLVADLTVLVQSGLTPEEQSERFRAIFVRDAALPQILRFVMGIAWRDMNDAQKAAFEEAFLDYVARTYAGLLLEYEGQTLSVTGAQDFGDKGVLVSAVATGAGVDGMVSEWLVSDRGGDGPKLIDITAEGISLLRSQRQEFAAMLEKRNGDIDRFIADLAVAG